MAKLNANRVLSGSFAELWIDGTRIAEASAITLRVTAERRDVQIGMDIESKLVGLKGNGEILLKQVFTRFYDVLAQAKKGVDVRVTVTTALKDPDSIGGAEERYSVSNVILEELPLIAYESGKINEQKIKLRFPPSELKILSAITPQEVS